MPMGQITPFIPTKVEAGTSRNITAADLGQMLIIDAGVVSQYTFDGNVVVGWPANAEVIIRNLSSSAENCEALATNGAVFDISPDLGAVIPPGGIMECKRIGSSLVFSVYGYIEA